MKFFAISAFALGLISGVFAADTETPAPASTNNVGNTGTGTGVKILSGATTGANTEAANPVTKTETASPSSTADTNPDAKKSTGTDSKTGTDNKTGTSPVSDADTLQKTGGEPLPVGCQPISEGCYCDGTEGLLCGNEPENDACTNGEVFWCFKTGRTCSFGHRNDCVGCDPLKGPCPPRH